MEVSRRQGDGREQVGSEDDATRRVLAPERVPPRARALESLGLASDLLELPTVARSSDGHRLTGLQLWVLSPSYHTIKFDFWAPSRSFATSYVGRFDMR